MPRDWLPVVWHEDSPDQQPAFENLEHANRVLGLVMEHYNGVGRPLMECPDGYSPLFSLDTRNNDVLWELWIAGFEQAIALRPATWKTLLDAYGDTAAAMSGMLLLIDIAQGEKKMDDQDPIVSATPDKIAGWVVVRNEWRLANTQAGLEEQRSALLLRPDRLVPDHRPRSPLPHCLLVDAEPPREFCGRSLRSL
ncbi:uncharacterized protein J2S34_003753 [Nitrobacter winogradskyi]|uniref:Uncharacterized protein n=2 Tax=Nitrobacter winogradskyi TaxID=913 RepID=A0ACC6AQ48_NITWI|nr:uncharacterized protein [Nitrobacter winogradskyi]GEC16799.1 hypothetical protein NWI01_26910 [Nitrobacter winogradskyi]